MLQKAYAGSISSSNFPTSTIDLSDQLAADNDFQEFTFLYYELFDKITKTKSGKLFINFLKKQNTKEENVSLIKNLGFSSPTEFAAFLTKTTQLKMSFQKRNENIFSLIDSQQIVEKAADKVASKNELGERYKNPQYICWATGTAIMAACMFYVCNEEGLDNCDCSFEFCMSVLCAAASLEYTLLCLWVVD